MTLDGVRFDIDGLHAAYRAGTATPSAVVREALARVVRIGDPGIFIHLEDAPSMDAAAAALPPFDPVGYPLWGVPCAIKDNIDVAGMPTTAACPAFAYMPQRSADVVDRLRAAGALILGKTNLDQFATGLVGVRTPYPVPRNAYDPTRVPGGSSSGSAVAVARGIVAFALGTDTAGSGRVPAALNDLVGLKPSLGALSTRGVVPACRSLDCVSIFAVSVADAERVYAVTAEEVARDGFHRPLAPLPPTRDIVRVAIPRPEDLRFFGDSAAEGAWIAALDTIARLGIAIEPFDMTPCAEAARLLYDGPWVAERHAATRTFLAANAASMHPVTRTIVEGAMRFSATDAFEAQYRLRELRHAVAPFFDARDGILVVPSVPTFPTLAELAADPIGPNARLGTYTNFVNLMDLAAIAVPGPFRTDGLPAGVTLVGARGSDATLAALARRIFPGAGARPAASAALAA